MSIELGDKVRDKITGLTGIVVAKTHYLTGCDRVSIQPQELKDGKTADWVAFDVNQVEIVKGSKRMSFEPEEPKPAKVGGPQPAVERW